MADARVLERDGATAEAEASLSYRVEGMDCASCAGKIETALGRLDGVTGVQVNFMAGRLAVTADGALVAPEAIERRIKSLGYVPTRIEAPAPRREHDAPDQDHAGHDHAHGARDEAEEGKPWWQTARGRLVLGVGALLAGAFLASWVAPDLSLWAYAAATVVGVVPFARRALALARSGSPFSIETLMTVAAVGALAIGEAEEAAIVVFLFAVGEMLEGVAAGRARAGIRALAALVPKTALVEEAGGATREVPADRLRPGQVVLVRPGARVPADGEIVEGETALDQSPVTGESIPVAKAVGDQAFAGSINTTGAVRLRVVKAAADNTIARIIRLVEEAQASKAPTARFIDGFGAWYTPAAMAVSAAVILVPPLLFGADWYTWLYRGLALLLIACPCALVLSTPAAIASGLAAGARRGLLIKGGAALETLGKAAVAAFDKTGTLTEGKPKVTDVVPLGGATAGEVLALAAAVEGGSSHPIARAVLDRAAADGLAVAAAEEAGAIPGKAARATVGGRALFVGSPRFAVEQGGFDAAATERAEALEAEGKTVVVLLEPGRALGLIAVRDEPRPDARAAIDQLGALGVRGIMLTGDNRRTGEAIARGLGLEVRAELLPDEKLATIGELKREAPVVMVGDGINDAPALAAASVGVAMGGGTDVALETADAALLKDRVTGVPELIRLSRATMANIRQNIAVALGLKGVFLVTTVVGATTLWMAILADTGATVLVTLNALRLLRFRGADE